jgi:preprotein translocase SecE subunit
MADQSDSGSSEDKRKPRVRKAPVSYRETVEKQQAKAVSKKAKPRRGRNAVRKAGKPFAWLGKGIKKVFRPLRFILRPFKTKPLRFIGNLLYKIFLIGYFKNSWKELRKVTWPGRRETWKLTMAVFMFAIVFGTMIALVDYGLDKVFKRLILK